MPVINRNIWKVISGNILPVQGEQQHISSVEQRNVSRPHIRRGRVVFNRHRLATGGRVTATIRRLIGANDIPVRYLFQDSTPYPIGVGHRGCGDRGSIGATVVAERDRIEIPYRVVEHRLVGLAGQL